MLNKIKYPEFFSEDEYLIFTLGLLIFIKLKQFEIVFILCVILWYWARVRYYEIKVIDKEDEIYQVYYNNLSRDVSQEYVDGKTEHDRKPLRHDLKQLENKRKFLIEKFMILNLVLIVLIELFIR